jgi:hypothetical protein
MCETITYSLNRESSPLNIDIKFIMILTTDPTSDTILEFNIPSEYHNYITFQSD